MIESLRLIQARWHLLALTCTMVLIAATTSHGLPLHTPASVTGHSSTAFVTHESANANATICRLCYLVSGTDETGDAGSGKAPVEYCCGERIAKPEFRVVASLGTMGLNSIEPWRDCYDGQDSLNTLRIGIALTSKVWQRLSIQEKITNVLAAIGQVNRVYEPQMNVRLVVGDVYISSTEQPWENRLCQLTEVEQYAAFQSWTKPSEHALWQLVDDCDDTNFVETGLALHGTVCTVEGIGVNQIRGDMLWLSIARNVGTNLDANPTLRRGGIMDLSNPKYQGLYQFHPDNAIEICSKIGSLREAFSSCTAWSLNVNESSCEDTPPPTSIHVNDQEMSCSELKALCKGNPFIEQTCPATCDRCIQISSQRPTIYPTPSPTDLAITTSHPSTSEAQIVHFLADGGGINDGSLLPCKIPFHVAGRTFNRCAEFTEATPFTVPPTGGYPFEPLYGTEKTKWCAVSKETYSNETEVRRRMWGYCRQLTKQPTRSPEDSEPPHMEPPSANTTTVVSRMDYRFLSFIPLLSIPALALHKKLRGK